MGLAGRGRLWGHWNAAGNRWRKPRGAKGWNTEVKVCAFICIPGKRTGRRAWDGAWEKEVEAGGRQVTEQ